MQRTFADDPADQQSPYIDKGACPGEWCSYGEWKAEKDTVLYNAPSNDAGEITTIKSGTKVIAVTGEVHSKPVKFIVKSDYNQYKINDIIWVYTYIGEGFFKVSYKGKMYEEDLKFSPYGGTSGRRCEKSPRCFGYLQEDLKFVWWVKILSPNGKIGWTIQPENFIDDDVYR